jgi:hypothetical protein
MFFQRIAIGRCRLGPRAVTAKASTLDSTATLAVRFGLLVGLAVPGAC